VVNEAFFLSAKLLTEPICDYLILNFQARLKKDRNPLLKDLKQEIWYY
jgi:hypothetical protein